MKKKIVLNIYIHRSVAGFLTDAIELILCFIERDFIFDEIIGDLGFFFIFILCYAFGGVLVGIVLRDNGLIWWRFSIPLTFDLSSVDVGFFLKDLCGDDF